MDDDLDDDTDMDVDVDNGDVNGNVDGNIGNVGGGNVDGGVDNGGVDDGVINDGGVDDGNVDGDIDYGNEGNKFQGPLGWAGCFAGVRRTQQSNWATKKTRRQEALYGQRYPCPAL